MASNIGGEIIYTREFRSGESDDFKPIVMANDGHVIWHSDATFFENVDAASSNLVILADNGIKVYVLVE